jgi:adenine deaminase
MGSTGITVVGATEEDMAGAVNRVKELHGGLVVYSEGRVLAELPMPIGGFTSDLPIEEVRQRYENVRQSLIDLGSPIKDIYLIINFLTTTVLPSLRICEMGLIDITKRKLLSLMA